MYVCMYIPLCILLLLLIATTDVLIIWMFFPKSVSHRFIDPSKEQSAQKLFGIHMHVHTYIHVYIQMYEQFKA